MQRNELLLGKKEYFDEQANGSSYLDLFVSQKNK